MYSRSASRRVSGPTTLTPARPLRIHLLVPTARMMVTRIPDRSISGPKHLYTLLGGSPLGLIADTASNTSNVTLSTAPPPVRLCNDDKQWIAGIG